MYTLATLDSLRAHLGLTAGQTSEDVRLLAALQASAAHLERAAGRRFSPHIAARRHTFTGWQELLLHDDLLELIALANGDGSAITLADVRFVPDEAPFGLLRLTGSSGFVWTGSPLAAISVSGVWGWHDHPAEMWRFSGDSVQNNPLSSSATSLTVSAAASADPTGEAPRFQVGHLLKIDSEYVRVVAVSGNTLTILRGVNGSTAASHVQNAPISVYQPAADVRALAVRWAAWLIREPDTLAAPPEDFSAALERLRRVTVRV